MFGVFVMEEQDGFLLSMAAKEAVPPPHAWHPLTSPGPFTPLARYCPMLRACGIPEGWWELVTHPPGHAEIKGLVWIPSSDSPLVAG